MIRDFDSCQQRWPITGRLALAAAACWAVGAIGCAGPGSGSPPRAAERAAAVESVAAPTGIAEPVLPAEPITADASPAAAEPAAVPSNDLVATVTTVTRDHANALALSLAGAFVLIGVMLIERRQAVARAGRSVV